MSMFVLTPMTREEAAALVDRMLGSYPSLSLHDPKTYIAAICSVLCQYPVWAGEKAINEAVIESKFIPPAPGVLKPLLESQVATARYADHWNRAAEASLRMIEPPRDKRLSMDELRAKYGPNWGIGNPDRKRPPTREESRAELVAQIGQEAFDAIPDAGHDTDTWAKLRAPAPPDEAL